VAPAPAPAPALAAVDAAPAAAGAGWLAGAEFMARLRSFAPPEFEPRDNTDITELNERNAARAAFKQEQLAAALAKQQLAAAIAADAAEREDPELAAATRLTPPDARRRGKKFH
jgi:hypothetical protein